MKEATRSTKDGYVKIDSLTETIMMSSTVKKLRRVKAMTGAVNKGKGKVGKGSSWDSVNDE